MREANRRQHGHGNHHRRHHHRQPDADEDGHDGADGGGDATPPPPPKRKRKERLLNLNQGIMTPARLPPVQLTADARGEIHFHVIGDWGGPGREPQRQVAESMAVEVRQRGAAPPTTALGAEDGDGGTPRPLSFVVSTGDNIYEDGAASVHDPRFRRNFENVYTQPELQVRWYMSLGNHDHGAHGVFRDVFAEVNYTQKSKRWFLPSTFYHQHFDVAPAAAEDGGAGERFDVDLFVLDTYDVSPHMTKMSAHQLKWLRHALSRAARRSPTGWRLVVGHRPIFSTGKLHGSSQYMQQQLLPTFREFDVSAYFCGDDHQLQVMRKDGMLFVVSGAGARSKHGSDLRAPLPNVTLFQDPSYGFVAVHLGADTMQVQVWDHRTKELFATSHLRRREHPAPPKSAVGE